MCSKTELMKPEVCCTRGLLINFTPFTSNQDLFVQAFLHSAPMISQEMWLLTLRWRSFLFPVKTAQTSGFCNACNLLTMSFRHYMCCAL